MDTDKLWYKNAVFYEVSVKSFKDSSGNGIGDIKGITMKLDYLDELGIDCLWLLPFFPSPWRDDGYDVADYKDIHTDLGTFADFEELIHEAEKRDIKIIIDLVTNHTSDQHQWFQESRKNQDEDNPYRDYYVWSDTDEKYEDVRIIFQDFESSNWTYDEQRKQYYWHRFYHHQPDLNYDNPKVHQEIFDVIDFWLEKGIAGFRVDAIPYLYEREGTSCENLQETHQFLQKMRTHIDKKYGKYEKIILCESNMWQEELLPYFGNNGQEEFHMGFDFPVMTRIYEALARQDVSPLLKVMGKAHRLPKNCQWATFLRNHDELTLEKVTPEVREFMWNYYSPDKAARINLGIRKRLASLMENNMKKIKLLNAFLFALPGSPIIYYGQEIGMGTDLTLNDRNGVRTPMQWDSSKNAGFSTANENDLVFPVIDDEEYGYHKVNVESQIDDPDSLLSFFKYLISLRKKYPFIGFSDYTIIPTNDNRGVIFSHEHQDEIVLCLFNFSNDTILLDIRQFVDKFPKKNGYTRLFEISQTHVEEEKMELDPYQFQWLYIS